jgi:hypothetical protein
MAYRIRQLSPDRQLRFFLFVCWLHACQAMEPQPFYDRRRAPQVHLINDRRHNRMAPTQRMMATITFGMVGVSVVAWSFASAHYPQALYMVPLYFVYVAIILVIKAARVGRWVGSL